MSYYNQATAETMLVDSSAEIFADFIEQQSSCIITVNTRGNPYPFIRTSRPHSVETVPQSFWNALADFEAGNVVDDEIALNEPPRPM